MLSLERDSIHIRSFQNMKNLHLKCEIIARVKTPGDVICIDGSGTSLRIFTFPTSIKASHPDKAQGTVPH